MAWTIEELLAASKKAAEAKAAAQVVAGAATEVKVDGAEKPLDGAAQAAAAVAAATAGKEAQTDKPGTGEVAGKVDGQENAATAAVGAAPAGAPDLSALVTKVTELSIENAKVTAERDSMLASCAALAQIAGDSLSRMNIALGGGKIDVSAMTPESLVAQHATVAAQFASRFPTGGVAAVSGAADAAAAEAKQADPMHARRMAAVIGTRGKE